MIDASWIIVERATARPVLETFNFELVHFVNLERYQVFTAHAWLVLFNAWVKL